MAGYQLHEDAREDLDAIWIHLAEEASPQIATKVENEFFEVFVLLSTQPRMGFEQPRLSNRSLRFWVLRDYLIAYAPEYDPVLILGVLHGRRHPQTIARILAERQ